MDSNLYLVGVDSDGAPVVFDEMSLDIRNRLIGAAPGMGKSALVNLITAHRALTSDDDRPAPDSPSGLWLTTSRWLPDHGGLDEDGYAVPPTGSRCVGCGVALSSVCELVAAVHGSDGLHYHCGTCATYLEED
ncbi:hypothetical protein [Actinoplanes sp. NPDC020271]|uniref:hypothetical protein n=1 Tax=Actinoplanes sp. NPDC020271 TaxID=3363896 RepID=UPI0037A3E345